MKIIGRKRELAELHRRYHSGRQEFVAIYGRRRVGKTFLVREAFRGKFAFYHTGLSPYDEDRKVTKGDQLLHFYHSLLQYGMPESSCPDNWLDAFFMLDNLLKEKAVDGHRQVVFIDELPWIDTPRSGFITALEAFWNGRQSGNEQMMLIVCGSATSWMLDNLINNMSGLYGRLTDSVHLSAFSLCECEEFFADRGVVMGRYDIITAYMALGGVPYYLDKFSRGLSLPQNLDAVLFAPHSLLIGEFNRLFGSLFSHPEPYIKVVELLSKRRCGYTRSEIAESLGLASGERLSKVLGALEASEFVVKYRPFDAQKRKEILYRLIDPFCRTYFHFVAGRSSIDPHFWQNSQNKPQIRAWQGLSFEDVCLLHVRQIKDALGIGGVESEQSILTLRADENHNGTQCDLIIRRADNVVNLCEMKFCGGEFAIDKAYDMVLRNRISRLQQCLKAKEYVHLTFVTTFGVKRGMYSGIVQSQVTADALFNP